MNLHKFLSSVVAYYDSTRGVGHTRVALNGVDSKTLFVGTTTESARVLLAQQKIAARPISIAMFEDSRVLGFDSPIVFDNHALRTLFGEMLATVDKKDRRIRKLEAELEYQDTVIKQYNAELTRVGKVAVDARYAKLWYEVQLEKVPGWLKRILNIRSYG